MGASELHQQPESFYLAVWQGWVWGSALYFVPLSQVAESEKYPAPGSSFSQLPLAVDGRVRVQVILYRVGPGTGDTGWSWRSRPLRPLARPQAAARGPSRPPRAGQGREGGKHLPRELLLQLPQALPGGLHVPQELGYFIVLGFGQLHASHRLISRGRACAAAGGATGASSAAPGPAPRPPRGRGPRSRQPRGALSYKPRAAAVRDGCGGRFPRLRPAAWPGRCGGRRRGEPPSRAARLCAAAQAGGERAAPGAPLCPTRKWRFHGGIAALVTLGFRLEAGSGASPEENTASLGAAQTLTSAPCKPLLALTPARAEGAGGRGGAGRFSPARGCRQPRVPGG